VGWIKLEKHSDWGHYYYAKEGEGLTEYGTANSSRGIRFKAGTVQVRFPDGKVANKPLKTKEHVEPVSDHASSSRVGSTFYGIEVEVYGIPQWIDLVDLEVDEDTLPVRRRSRP